MKKQAYIKNQLRTIFKTKARFLSIFCIVFLGASFFAGLRHSPLIMEQSINDYLQKYQFNDLNYIATLGFTEDDVAVIEDIDEVKNVEYGYRFDALVDFNDQVSGATVYANVAFDNQVNQVELVAGKLPESDDECLIDHHFAYQKEVSVGDVLLLSNDNGTKEFTVVGIINDPRYLSTVERGTNTLGDGTNQSYIEILSAGNEDFALAQDLYDLRETVVFNDIRVTLKNENNYDYFSNQYIDYVNEVNEEIAAVLNKRVDDVNNQIITDAKAELDEGYQEYNDGLNEYQDGLKQYNDGVSQYEDGLKQYQDGLKQYNDGYSQYQDGLKQYNEGYSQYQDGLKQYNDGVSQYEQGYNEYLAGYNQYQEGLNQYNEQVSQYEQLKSQYEQVAGNYDQLVATYEAMIQMGIPETDEQMVKLKEQITQIETMYAYIVAYESELPGAKEQLDQTYHQLEQARITLEDSKVKLDENKVILDQSAATLAASKQTLDETGVKLSNSKQELDNAKTTLDETKQILDDTKIELDKASQELADALVSLQDGKEAIDDIPEGELITLTKEENAGILSFASASASIEAIAAIFPLIFFLVAALVSMTTMTRMVEEQRVQSGTFRALGYHRRDIVNQYIVYAFLATFIASILGIIAGVYFFPTVIYSLYRKMLFNVGAPTHTIFNLSICIQTFLISVAVILLVTYLVARREVNQMPASLLRPKAPKMGKRIILEKITYIWSRLSFNQKVTMRNIFRYKKRFFMSIIGIAGCTALIVTGFGIRSSVSPLADLQYGDIYTYDGLVVFQNDLEAEVLANEIDEFANLDSIDEVASFYRGSITAHGKKDYYGTLEVFAGNEELSKFVNLEDYQSQQPITLSDDGVIISAKLSELLNVGVGDMIEVTINDDDYQIKVTGLMTLYFGHQIYMSEAYYQTITGETMTENYAYFTLNSLDDEAIVTKYCNQDELISSVNYTDGLSQTFRDQIISIDSVVIILIACAGALAFIVLYNLTNINIQERKSEIATIKVLGFYPKEVYDYVFRENIILAIIGSVFGLGFGKLLHMFIIYTVEVELAMFIRSVNLMSFVLAIVLTMVFTYLIDFGMRHVLRKIDMVESLKSIE